jgi:ubiquinone/menaquinone biosynthesis C-methylase UbiE
MNQTIFSSPAPSVAVPVCHCSNLLRQRLNGRNKLQGLVVGCGSGIEAVYLQRSLENSHVVGLDIDSNFSPVARTEVNLAVADANYLAFADSSFDFVVTIHSLEHAGDPSRVLGEIYRVLKPGGWLYVGVPNKTRLIGYIGSFDASIGQKILWNLKDYAARISGRFDNVSGAHAGFQRNELITLLKHFFSITQMLTEEYYRLKYEKVLPRRILNLLLLPSLIDYMAAAHYALCQKEK